jgi:tRNA threonylcarbamoyl adenosine modification protein YeaZ
VLTLAIDTSSIVTSVALHDGVDVVQSVDETAPHRHGELLAPAIDAMLRSAGVGPRALERIAVGVGPGPFTGLRVGLMTARALGHALDIEVIGVGSLDAIAAQRAGRPLVVATDARRREVYWATYGADGSRTAGPAVDTPVDVARRLRESGFDGQVIGPGRDIYAEAFADFVTGPEVLASAAWVARLAAVGWTAASTAPLYLRRPDATAPGPRKTALR